MICGVLASQVSTRGRRPNSTPLQRQFRWSPGGREVRPEFTSSIPCRQKFDLQTFFLSRVHSTNQQSQ